MADYLHAHDVLIARCDQVEAELAKLALSAPCAHTIARLRCLRGIDTLSALGLCAEIGEWRRFDHPDQLSAYLGIVPSERTSGSQRRLRSITRAGSTHARRLLVEASYHYRRGPAVGEALERRQRGQAPEIINISWKAQRRLNARWRQLKDTRRKPGELARDRDRAQQLRDSSPEQRPPPGAALDNRQRTCDEQRSWGTQPPNMSMTPVANPRTPGPPRKPQPTSSNHHTNQTMAIHPYPLTPAPPYGRQGSRQHLGGDRLLEQRPPHRGRRAALAPYGVPAPAARIRPAFRQRPRDGGDVPVRAGARVPGRSTPSRS
jgi:hypothetical protein